MSEINMAQSFASTHTAPVRPNDGGNAFPEAGLSAQGRQGMSLRDYFAAKALHAAYSAWDSGYFGLNDGDGESSNAEIAKCAYQLADAMLKARGTA